MMTRKQQAVVLRKLLEKKLGKKPEMTRREVEHAVRCSIIGVHASLPWEILYSDEYCNLLEIINENPEGIMEEIRPSESANMSLEELKYYFFPNRLVGSYGGDIDRVLGFSDRPHAAWMNWSVTVTDTKEVYGDTAQIRIHCTMPDYRELYKYRGLNFNCPT